MARFSLAEEARLSGARLSFGGNWLPDCGAGTCSVVRVRERARLAKDAEAEADSVQPSGASKPVAKDEESISNLFCADKPHSKLLDFDVEWSEMVEGKLLVGVASLGRLDGRALRISRARSV